MVVAAVDSVVLGLEGDDDGADPFDIVWHRVSLVLSLVSSSCIDDFETRFSPENTTTDQE